MFHSNLSIRTVIRFALAGPRAVQARMTDLVQEKARLETDPFLDGNLIRIAKIDFELETLNTILDELEIQARPNQGAETRKIIKKTSRVPAVRDRISA